MSGIRVTAVAPPRTITGTAHTFTDGGGSLANDDAVIGVVFNSPNPVTATVPKDATVNFPVGVQILLSSIGDGQVTVAPEDGTVTVLQIDYKYKLRGKGAPATLWKIAPNYWLFFGDLTS